MYPMEMMVYIMKSNRSIEWFVVGGKINGFVPAVLLVKPQLKLVFVFHMMCCSRFGWIYASIYSF